MSDDNGFVERPVRPSGTNTRRPDSFTARLRATADNGKAIVMKKYQGGYTTLLRSQGFQMRVARQPDGTLLAWCERIEPAAGASS